MNDIDRLWKLLEDLPVREGVIAEWQSQLGPAFDVVKSYFLKRTERQSQTYPCTKQMGDSCPRKIVVHAEDDIVAVCGNWPSECDTISVSRNDLVVFTLRLDSIVRYIAKACGFSGSAGNTVGGIKGVYSLGTYTPPSGPHSPAYFVIPDLRNDYDLAERHLVSIHKSDPPLLLLPTGERLKPEDRQIADSRIFGFVKCSEILAWDSAQKLVATTSIERALAGETTGNEPVTSKLPPKAACFTDASFNFILVSSDAELDQIQADQKSLDHFVDALAPNRPAKKRIGKKRSSHSLTPAETSMLIAYLLRAQHKDEPIEPRQLRLDNPGTQDGRAQAFKTLRQKIDVDGALDKQKRLFKSHPATEGRRLRHAFDPDSDTKFSFIFPVDAYQTVRQQLKK